MIEALEIDPSAFTGESRGYSEKLMYNFERSELSRSETMMQRYKLIG